MMMIDVIPQEFFDAVPVPPAVTLDGELLGALEDAPAGAWLAQMLDGVDVTSLTTFELPTYLRTAAKVQAWAASCVDSGIAELASRRDVDNVAADADIALALREPLRLAQTRIHRALRLRRLLPAFKRAFHRGDLSEYDVAQLVDATSCTDDPDILTRVQESTLANLRGQSGAQLRRYARRLLDRLPPPPAQHPRPGGPRQSGRPLAAGRGRDGLDRHRPAGRGRDDRQSRRRRQSHHRQTSRRQPPDRSTAQRSAHRPVRRLPHRRHRRCRAQVWWSADRDQHRCRVAHRAR